MLKIYNTLTHQKEDFVPLNPNKVRLYVCGMTVYDHCHIGHARVMVVFDVVVRHLRALSFSVDYVRNVTDIDDKIIDRAAQNQEEIGSLTERTIRALQEDTKALHILDPTAEPRATAYLSEMKGLISSLIHKGYAYVAENGDVYYSVRKFAEYGKLSHKTLDFLLAGARVEVNEQKKSPLDFVLWKAAKPNEPAWDSPWGKGRPGWHIECSAMSMACLGEDFDIHGGGMDLQFPHHENEIAQSEAHTGKSFVKTWMHVGFVQVEEEKMSKSLGNFATIRQVLKNWDPEVIRYFLISGHYRKPLSYSEKNLVHARESLERLYLALRGHEDKGVSSDPQNHFDGFKKRFMAAMNDDFNTPEALAVLFELAREINKEADLVKQGEGAQVLKGLAKQLGLLDRLPEQFLKGTPQAVSTDEIERLILERARARTRHDWAASDQIRNDLLSRGISLEDGPGGTTWRKLY